MTPEDVLVSVQSTATFDVETDGRFVAWLDLELDAALIAEGLAREAVNRINTQRKETGLAVEDRIVLELAPEGAELAAALLAHEAFVAGETLAARVVHLPAGSLADGSLWDLGHGQLLRARIARA